MSEHSKDAGMIARYEIHCQHAGCPQTSSYGCVMRRHAAYNAHRSGWQYIDGAWYCVKCAGERMENERR